MHIQVCFKLGRRPLLTSFACNGVWLWDPSTGFSQNFYQVACTGIISTQVQPVSSFGLLAHFTSTVGPAVIRLS
jgi:hypothetical protein